MSHPATPSVWQGRGNLLPGSCLIRTAIWPALSVPLIDDRGPRLFEVRLAQVHRLDVHVAPASLNGL